MNTLLIAWTALSFLFPVGTGALSIGGGKNDIASFGGIIGSSKQDKISCTCMGSGNYAINVKGPYGGRFLLSNSTDVFAYGGVNKGEQILGTYRKKSDYRDAACWVTAGPYCAPIITKGKILKVGTSGK